MAAIWTVQGGQFPGKYLQLFKGGIFYPLRDELAAEMLSRCSFRDVEPTEEVQEFKSAGSIRVQETEGEGPELVMHPTRDGEIKYSLRLSVKGESFFISPYFAYGLKHTNKLGLVEVGRSPSKKELGRSTVYRLSPMEPSCVDAESGRICSYRA